MTNRIENCQDLFALVWSLMKKTKQENDLIDHATVFYFKNDTKLSWWIRSSDDYDVNQIVELRD